MRSSGRWAGRGSLYPSHSNHFSWERGHGFKRGFGGVWIIQQEVPVIVEREPVRAGAGDPPPPSKLGRS